MLTERIQTAFARFLSQTFVSLWYWIRKLHQVGIWRWLIRQKIFNKIFVSIFVGLVAPFPPITRFQRSRLILAFQSTISTFVTFLEQMDSIKSFQTLTSTIFREEISICSCFGCRKKTKRVNRGIRKEWLDEYVSTKLQFSPFTIWPRFWVIIAPFAA